MGSVAVALGAKVIEKHFTLDQSMKGPDHKASLNPEQLIEYVSNIRNTELALGDDKKKISTVEKNVKEVARKSIITKVNLPKGIIISEDHITTKRPGTGIPAGYFSKVIGKKLNKDVKKDYLLKWDDLD
jgi:sialic acid synthase SpsE